MTNPLLTTKLGVPATRSDLVRRPHLIERLNQGVGGQLVLIAAPAGFGKTTVLSTWAEENDLPIAWLSLEMDDNDPARFFTYFVAALQMILPESGHTALAMLQSSSPSPLGAVLRALINELSSVAQKFAVILDDYQFIKIQEIHSSLGFLLDHLPPQMHLLIACRSDPPLPLSRLRARGQLMELRQADLRFTSEEAAIFLNQRFGLNLTPEQIGILEAKTEGWIAGLQLAALSMREKEDIPAFIQAFSGSHRFVIDYLVDEVLAHRSDDLRRFLVQTSILDRFTAPLCDAVTGRNDSNALMRVLEGANLFLIPLDDQRVWYRYHHLFRDYLSTELDEQTATNLHKKAAIWLTSRGYSSEAVKHALASGDTAEAVRAISSAAPEAFGQAAFQSLLAWLDALPENTVLEDGELSTYKGYALLLTRSYEEARPYVQAAEKSLPSAIQGVFMSLQAYQALYEEQIDVSIQLSREALEYLEEEAHFFRSLTLNVLGQVLEIKGDVISAADIYRQAFKSGWQAGDQVGALIVFTNLVFTLNELGRRREAVAWCKQVVADHGAQSGRGAPLADAAYLAWSLLSYEANELDVAREQAQRALDMVRVMNIPQGISWGLLVLGRIHLAKGEFDDMLEITQEGRQLASQMGMESMHGTWFAALEAQASLEQGDLHSARQWAEREGLTPKDSFHHWVEQPYFTYTRSLLAQGHFDQARSLIHTMEASARNGGRQRKLMTIFLLDALYCLAMGDEKEALNRVQSALELAAPEDYFRAFLDEGQKIASLLPKVRSTAPAFVDELLVAFRSKDTTIRQAQDLLDPLTDRELQVLRLVAQGLSNREIAEALVVTLGTSKKHLNNIFSKLGVKSRTQAVAKGRELGLLK